MKVVVPFFVAAIAIALVPSVHAQTALKSTIGGATTAPILQSTSKTLTSVATTSKSFTPSGFDMLLPVEVYSMQQIQGGTFLQFNFRTTAPAVAMICLSTTWIEPARSVSGNWTVSGSVERFAISPEGVNHSVVAKGLDPHTVYYVVILLSPPPQYNIAGWKPYHTYDVTLRRKVTVSIPFIFVIDDSDDLSAGDLMFGFQIGEPAANFNVAGNSWDHAEDPVSGDLQIDSGDGFWPVVTLTKIDAGDEVKVAVSCNDRDSMSAGALNTPDEYLGTGNNDFREWNSGWWIYNIAGGTDMSPGATPHENERFSFDFIETVPESEESCLEYQVWGSVSVTYVP